MFQELKFQLSSAILTVVTIAAVVAGVLNYEQNRRFQLPDDGVTWVDRREFQRHVVEAYQVEPESERLSGRGLHKGDEILAINGAPTAEFAGRGADSGRGRSLGSGDLYDAPGWRRISGRKSYYRPGAALAKPVLSISGRASLTWSSDCLFISGGTAPTKPAISSFSA